MLNTYGIRMNGIKKASGETFDYGPYSSQYVEIFYNRETGAVWTVYHVSIGRNSWTVYDDPAIIKVCDAQRHMSMQDIADAVNNRLQELASCIA